MPGHLNGFFQLALVVRAGTRHPSGHDLAPLGDKSLQELGVLIINGYVRVLAESAYPSSHIDPFLR